MTIRHILVPIRGDGKGEGVLDNALCFGRRFNTHLDVVHCRPRPEDLIPFGVSVPALLKKTILASAGGLADEEERKVKDLFANYCQRNQLTVVEQPPWPEDQISISWREKTGKQAAIVALYGRLADLIVVAQPDRERNLGMNTLEAALLETGKLVLMSPPTPVTTCGDHVAVAWNGSCEAARAVAMALPIPAAAGSVTIVSLSDQEPPALGPDDLKDYLASHGISAATESRRSKPTEVGGALLDAVKSVGADVLLMGAFGQARRRELVMGGVTQHLMDHADVPVLLVH